MGGGSGTSVLCVRCRCDAAGSVRGGQPSGSHARRVQADKSALTTDESLVPSD